MIKLLLFCNCLITLFIYSQEISQKPWENSDGRQNDIYIPPIPSENLLNFSPGSASSGRFLLSCYQGCSDCSTSYFDGCTMCSSGYYFHEGMCVTSCPTGWPPSSGTCTQTSSVIFDFTFNQIQGYFDFPSSELRMICGNSPIKFYPDYDSNDPYPTQTSGYYFESSSSYMQLPPNSWSKDDFILNHKHTISIWLWRRKINFGLDYLLQKMDRDGNGHLALSIRRNLMTYEFTVYQKIDDSYMDLTSNWGFAISDPTTGWHAYTFVMDYLKGIYTASFYENNNKAETQTFGTPSSPAGSFQWYPEGQCLIGFFNDMKHGLDGWIGEFAMYSNALSETQIAGLYSTSLCSSCNSLNFCPISTNSCFSTCGFAGYITGSTCGNCSPSCIHPCVSSSNTCSLCNGNCEKYCNGFSSSDCKNFRCTECQTCSGPEFYSCLTCGGIKYLWKGVCVYICPGKGSDQPSSWGEECKTSSGYDVILQSIGGNFLDSKGNYLFSPESGSSPNYDPIPCYKRGYYFNGVSSSLKMDRSTLFRFDIDHTQSFWLKTQSSDSQTIICKLSPGEFDINLLLRLVNLQLSAKIRLKTTDSSINIIDKTFSSITQDKWEFLIFIIRFIKGSTYSKTCIFTTCTEFILIGEGYLEDYINSDYYGTTYLSGQKKELFKGFIYEMTYDTNAWSAYTISKKYTNTCSGGCSSCPVDGKCLLNCQWNEYYDSDSGTCLACSDPCKYGCTNGINCNLCAITACLRCKKFTDCDQCYPGASWNDMSYTCACPNGKIWNLNTFTCDYVCFKACSTCSGNRMDECISCKSGYLLYNGFCVQNCPVPFTIVDKSCNKEPTAAIVLHWIFTKLMNTQFDIIKNYPMFLGTSDSYYPNYDLNDPTIFPYRGLFFNGKAIGTINVPLGSASSKLYIGLTHSIDIWTMVFPETLNGLIFGIYTWSNSVLSISAVNYNSSHFYIQASYGLTSLNSSDVNLLRLNSSYYAYSTWQRVIISYSYENRVSIVRLFINTKLEDTLTIADYCYYDDYNYTISLGKTTSNFIGYAYMLRLYYAALQSITHWASVCGYPYCTDYGDRLINCQTQDYYNESSKTCTACDSTCKYGCIREGSICNLNQDALCYSYTGFAPEDCTQCKTNSTKARQCECDTNFVYDSATETCICKVGYQYWNVKCIACERYLQPSELTGYFTSTFVRVIFDFAISVNTTNLNCEKVFTNDTIEKFGRGYVCAFDSQGKEITVDLGNSFTLTNEIIKIENGALKGTNPQCGYFPYDLSTTLTYSASLPYPSARIDAPGAVLYNCQDLYISGRKSTGGVKSNLYYKWEIISDPSWWSLSKYNTVSQKTISEFTISRSDLITTNITIKLTVRNKFNNENSASVTVISLSDGLSVNFDKSIDYQIVATNFEAYAIGSISSCSSYNNLRLKWKLVSAEGNISAINEEAIWSSQTQNSGINIPQKSIPPFTKATFSVEAEDSGFNLWGSNSVEISIIPAPPVIEFSRTNGSADVSSFLSINASSSYDPNEDKSLSFEWSCIQGYSGCSLLIPDVKAMNLNIPSNTLQAGKEYKFELLAKADFSSRRFLRENRLLSDRSSQTKKVITISTVNYATPSFTILNPLTQSQPSIVTANAMALFQAKINGDMKNQYTFQWSVDNTSSIKFSTPLTQLFISIVEGTLEIGHTYTLTLSVYDGTNYSYFKYTFYVNSPPYSGTLTVTPTSGIEMETIFKMEALGWVDDENNLPISYSYGYLSGSSDTYLNFKNQSTSYFSAFPYVGNSLTVFVDTYDSLGASSRKTSNISISANKFFDQEGLFSNYTNYINSIASNSQSYPGVISVLCASILNRDYYLSGNFQAPSNKLIHFYKNVIESVISWTEKLVQLNKFDSQSVSVFSNLLSMITLNPYLNSNTIESKVCNIIINIFSNIPTSQMLQRQQPYKYLEAVSQAYIYTSASIVASKSDLKIAVEALNSVEKLVCAQMVLSEIRNITVNNLGVAMAVMALSDMNGYKFVSSNGKASITFPMDFSTKMATVIDEKYVNLALSVFDCPNNPNNLSSSVVDFTMYGHTSNKEISANLTTSNVLVQIPVWNIKYSNYTPQCVFLDTKTMNWSTEGCTRYKINSYDIICSCNHFTTFAALNAASSTLVDSNIGDTVNAAAWSKINSSNAIGLYFCITTLVIYGIFGFFAYKKDRKEEREDENERIKLMGIPQKIEKITTRWGSEDCIEEELNAEAEKKKCWPSKKGLVNDENPEKPFNAPDEVIIYNSPIVEEDYNIADEDDKNTSIKRWFGFLLNKHELLNIMFAKRPERPSFSRLTLFFLGLLGQMFFIGMFYQDAYPSDNDTITNNSTNSTDSTDNSSSDSPINYSWSDFWIMVWSSLFMIVITMILNYFLREKLTDIHMTAFQYKTLKKQNKIKRWTGIILAWGFMLYFCWSIALFAIQFKQSVSKTWVLNTGISYSVEIFLTSVVKAAVVSFIMMKLIDFYEKYKSKKYRENNEVDIVFNRTGEDPSAV